MIVLAEICGLGASAEAEAPAAAAPAFDATLTERLGAAGKLAAASEMVAEYHKLFRSAALMLVKETHQRIAKKQM